MSIINRPKGRGLPTSKGGTASRSEYDDILLRRNSRVENKMSKDSYFYDRAQKVISKNYSQETKMLQQKVMASERGGQQQKFATGYRQIPSISNRDKGPIKYTLKNGNGNADFFEREHSFVPIHGSRQPSGGKTKSNKGKSLRSVQSTGALADSANDSGYLYKRRGSDGVVSSRNELSVKSRNSRRSSADVGHESSTARFLNNRGLSSVVEPDSADDSDT